VRAFSIPFLLLVWGQVGHSVTVTVFYDENGNGRRDPFERVTLPQVTVEAAGLSARTSVGTGSALLNDLPGGTQEFTIKPDSVPPFFVVGPPTRVDPAESQEVALPLTLPIGSNRANTYLAFGDSISAGEGSRDGKGFSLKLEAKLREYFGEAHVVADGVSGLGTDRGVRRLRESLARTQPAYTLVLLGTNDWDDSQDSKVQATAAVERLRTIVRRIRGVKSLPFIASVLPPNVGFDWRVPPERGSFVRLLNEMIEPMAKEEGAVFIDLYRAFEARPDPQTLFKDHLHPNDRGYDLIAETMFQAIVRPETVAP
jgi:acyl-CoA thioesterase-1